MRSETPIEHTLSGRDERTESSVYRDRSAWRTDSEWFAA
jgi:hypothetical protein